MIQTTISSVVGLALMVGVAWGQPRVPSTGLPLPLLPAQRAWLVTLDAPSAAGGAMDDVHTYVPLQDARVVALNRETGALVWTRALETVWTPVVSGGRVYVAGPGHVHALDAMTGDTLWRVAAPDLAAPLELRAGILVGISGGTTVEAFRAADGVRLWRQVLDARPLAVAVGDGQPDAAAYVVLEGGRLVSLGLADGRRRWERGLTGTLSTPAAGRDRVVVGSTDNFFYALDAASGDVSWTWRSGGDAIGATVDDARVYLVSLDNTVRAVNRANGNQRWRRTLPTRPVGPPRAVGGLVVVPGIAPAITAFDGRNGSTAGTYAAAGELRGTLLIDVAPKPFRVAVVAVFRDGRVEGLRPTGLQFLEPPPTPVTALPGRVIPPDRPPGALPR